jgi:hypothetical protein
MNSIIGMFLMIGLYPAGLPVPDTCKGTLDTLIGKTVYAMADEMPAYPGGHAAMMERIAERLRITDDIDFQARFVVDGVVDKDGTYLVYSINGHTYAQMSGAEQSMLRTIHTLHPWTPGRCRGRVVPVRMRLPIYL